MKFLSSDTLSFLERAFDQAVTAAEPLADAGGWFAIAEQREAESDDDAAEAAYRRDLALDPTFGDAYLNLGALLCERGSWSDAVALYDAALQRLPAEPMLHFNHAVALEDGHLWPAAIVAYSRCLQLDDAVADAHYNIARMHEKMGQSKEALRHLNAYRRLQRSSSV